MNRPHAQQWVYAIHNKLEELKKNTTWQLVSDYNIELDDRLVSGKWVFKVKRDINGAIVRFKAR